MNKKLWTVMSLALALPSSIMAVTYIVYQLVENKLINLYVGSLIIVVYIVSLLFMMVKGANSKKN